MNAFLLLHFGNNKTYFEYELYFLCMLRDNTTTDIIYFYSTNDTPEYFITIIKSLNLDIKCIGIDDKDTYNIKFNSIYGTFNLLRMCNYIYVFLLKEYETICIVESDMIITSEINSIFDLKCPSILYYKSEKITTNELINNKEKDKFTFLGHAQCNGGIMLIKPNIKTYYKLLDNLSIVVQNNSTYPSESLFTFTFTKFYNLPIMYNMPIMFVDKYNIKEKIIVMHYNNTKYKPLYVIRDKTFNIYKMKNPIKQKYIIYFKEYYNKYKKIIENIINNM